MMNGFGDELVKVLQVGWCASGNRALETTEIISDGQSQAVKLPDGYRFEGTAVSIRREGEAVILEPLKPREWPAGFFDQILVNDPAFCRPDQGSMPQGL